MDEQRSVDGHPKKYTQLRLHANNIKCLIRDKEDKYLVGVSSYPSKEVVYSLLGGHGEKGEMSFETLGREILEETSLVLELNYDSKNGFYIKDALHNTLFFEFEFLVIDSAREPPASSTRTAGPVSSQWFVGFYYSKSLSPYIESWRSKFFKTQIQIKRDAVESLREFDPNLKWDLLFELFLKRKFEDVNKELKIRLTKGEIQDVKKFMKSVSYYLENKDLILVDKKDLIEKIYEKIIIQYI
jgi:8-oxo-dGTP pyrophosphatase MutT (NUDIX family)